MSRLPTPGADTGTWGNVLNDFLSVAHNPDGTIKVDTDGTLAANSDGKISSQKATKTYVDAQVTNTISVLPYSSVVTNTPLNNTYSVVSVDATLGGVTITLPTAIGNTGRTFSIKKSDSSGNFVTIATTGLQTIDGSSTALIKVQYVTVLVISNGTNWQVI